MLDDVLMPAPTPTPAGFITAKDLAASEHISIRRARRYLRRRFGAGTKLFFGKPELWPTHVVRAGIKHDKEHANGGWEHNAPS